MSFVPGATLLAATNVVEEAKRRNGKRPISRREPCGIKKRPRAVKDGAICSLDDAIGFGPIRSGTAMRQSQDLGRRNKLTAVVRPEGLAFAGPKKMLDRDGSGL
jgi:hypothetical protein